MSEWLEARAEVLKIERLLEADAGAFEFLADLPADELKAFRQAATDRLFGASALGNVAGAARLLPAGVIATIAQRAFGPLLCARAAGGVDPKTAIEVARRLPPEFLTDVSIHLDPRRVAKIIAGVPPDLVPGVAERLGQREEYVTMGRFLAFVPDSAIAAAMGVLSDEALVRTAFVLEHKDRLDHAIGLLPPERIPGVLRFAAANDLWPEALDLLDQLSDARRGPIADVVAKDAPDILDSLVASVHASELWDVMLPLVSTMQPISRERLAQVPAFHDDDVLTGIIVAATGAPALWTDLMPLLDVLPADVRARLPGIIAGLGDARIEAVIAAAHASELWGVLLPIVGAMEPDSRRGLAQMPAFHAPEVLTGIVVAAASVPGLWADLVPLLDVVPADVQEQLPDIIGALDPCVIEAVVAEAAKSPEALVPLIEIAAQIDGPGRAAVITVIDAADEGLARPLVVHFGDLPEAGVLLRSLPDDVRAALSRAADRLGLGDLYAEIERR